MTDSRRLAEQGEPHGTVVCADFQEAGRGRTAGRVWRAERGKNLFFTILLRYGAFAAIPPALTLRTGLALSLAIEDFVPALRGKVLVKWPNDIIIGAGKAAGILTESDGSAVHIGVGLNIAQTAFPEELRGRAASIALALQALPAAGELERVLSPGAAYLLLEAFLSRFHAETEAPAGDAPRAVAAWRPLLERRLFMRGRHVTFLEGPAGQARPIQGILEGLGSAGEILIRPAGEEAARSFITGELRPAYTP
jgi:BirA family biotin operon repressor/biotin-[acetyl-CoA-carboxylase] ligase